MKDQSLRSGAIKAALALGVFAVVHSALASLRAKELARERLGERTASGLYRFAFNAFAGLSLAVFLRFIWQLPDRPLYRVRGVAGALMAAGQLAALVAVIAAARQVGFARIAGITAFRQYLKGEPILPTPPVQHPDPEGPGDELGWHGPYSISSHPANYFAMLVILLSPVMTVKWGAIALATVVYMISGSSHEDRRLLAAYGERYVDYRQRVPQFAIPVRRLVAAALPRLARLGAMTSGETQQR